MTSKLVVNTIEADTGISSVSFASSISLSSTSVFHLGDAGFNIGADTNINRPGNGVIGFNINGSEKVRITSAGDVGIGTALPPTWATGSNLSIAGTDGGQLELKKISSDIRHYVWADDDLNIAAGYAGAGSGGSSALNLKVNGNNTRLRIGSAGQIGIAGANYGDAGQVLTSQGSGSAPTWASVSAPLSFRNLIINGDMRVAQRSVGPVAVSDNNNEGYQTIDRMRFGFGNSAAGACNISQSTDAPTTLGFTKSHKTDVTTVNTTASGQEVIQLFYRIEGQDLRNSGWNHLSSSSFLTLSFYFKTTKTGTSKLPIMFRTRHGTNYYYVKNVTVTDPTNWNRYTVTIPGNSNIQIDDATTVGMDINFTYYSGSDKDTSSEGSWGSTNAYSTSDSTNYFDSTSNDMFITGIQLEVGDTVTPFEHRSFTDEELLCHRYYLKYSGTIYGCVYGGSGFCHYSLPTRMRIKGALSYDGIRTTSGFYDYSTAQLLQIQMSSTSPYITNPQLDSEL